MITLKKISRIEVWPLVELSYQGDEELFQKYHIAKMRFEDCVKSTIEMIEAVAKIKDLSCYKVLFKKKAIGYVIAYKEFLYSYAINVNFRKKEILVEWWEQVKRLIGKQFATGLYENNTRAIDFLKKQGMSVVGKERDMIILINTR
jgi:hypothetical protein